MAQKLFCKNLTEANRIAQEDLKAFKNQNVNFSVQNIDEIDTNDSDWVAAHSPCNEVKMA